MIAGEQRVLLDQRVGGVVARVTGRRYRLQRPALALKPVAVMQDARGRVIGIVRGIEAARPARRRRERRAADDRGTGLDRERARARRVISMGVREHDVRHALAGGRGEQRVEVRLVFGTGIDDRDGAAPDDVGAGAREGERPRVAADDAADQG